MLPVSPSIGCPFKPPSEYSRGSTAFTSSGTGISSKALYITPSSNLGSSLVNRSPISSNALVAFSLICSPTRPTRSPIALDTLLGVTPCIMPAGKNTSSHALKGLSTIFCANSPGLSIARPIGLAIGSIRNPFAVVSAGLSAIIFSVLPSA